MKNVALITWASSWLWKEFAKIHAKTGWDLIIIARRKEKLIELKWVLEEKYNIKVKIIVKDLTNENAATEIYNELKNIEVEYLINNAGFWGIWKFYERDWEDDKAMIRLNITTLTELCKLFLEDFTERNSWKILNVSSTASLLAWPNQAVYYATKAYVTSFSNALSEELYNHNVTVSALLPWATETEFWKKSGMDKTTMFLKTSNAYSVASAWYHGMIQWKLNIIAGVTFTQKILIFLLPFIPKKLLLKQIRKSQEIS